MTPWNVETWRVVGTRVPKFLYCYCNEHAIFREGTFSILKVHTSTFTPPGKIFAKRAFKLIISMLKLKLASEDHCRQTPSVKMLVCTFNKKEKPRMIYVLDALNRL